MSSDDNKLRSDVVMPGTIKPPSPEPICEECGQRLSKHGIFFGPPTEEQLAHAKPARFPGVEWKGVYCRD